MNIAARSHFTHFTHVGDFTVCWRATECDSCGKTCSSLRRIYKRDPVLTAALEARGGLMETSELPEEPSWSYDLDMAVCDDCWV